MVLSSYLFKCYPKTFFALKLLDTLSLYGMILGALVVLSSSTAHDSACNYRPTVLVHLLLLSNALSVVERH